MRLPDIDHSRAVLIGVSDFLHLPPLPSVTDNVQGLSGCLGDTELWGLPESHRTIVTQPTSAADIIDAVEDATRGAEDTLLVYYAGHGLVDSWNGELSLALVGSVQGRAHTAIPYEWVRRAIVDSRAERRILILDCCYSGRALGTMGDVTTAVADQAVLEGTFVLAAAAENQQALAPPGETYTAFTGELITLLRNGVSGGPELLDLNVIYRRVREALQSKSRPVPQKRDRNTAGDLALVRNRAWKKPPATKPAASGGGVSIGSGKPPRLLSNRYELGETLGYGGMSEVHRGRDVRLGREVAVKVLRAELARDPQFQLRFRREAQHAASLNHPAIVAVYDTGETRTEYGPLSYIVMEYVDGRTLRDIVKVDGSLPLRRAIEIMADVCAALDFAHRRQIIHRDVKASNVMITRTGSVRVMDFGIAKALADEAITMSGVPIGSAEGMSPEQALGQTVDARSDVYGSGCLLYRLLTGEPPFTGHSPVAVAYQHAREDPRPPSAVNPRIGPVLDAVVLKAMSKNPANRYQSAAEMRVELVRVLSGQRPNAPMVMAQQDRTTMLGQTGPPQVIPGRSQPEPLVGDDDRRRGRKIIIAVAAVVIAVLVLIGLTLAGVFNSDPPKAAVPNVVGQEVAQAELALAEQGLKSTRNLVPSSDEDNRKVIKTNPAADSEVEKGSTVALDIGNGPAMVKVPSLIDLTPEQADGQLRQAGLALAATRQQQVVTDQNKIGKIVAQNPQPLVDVPAGTQVQLTVGVDPATVKVANVVGLSFDEAKVNLENQDLVVQWLDVDSDEPKGEVVAQDPKAGTEVNKGTIVSLQVSKGT